MRRHNGRELMDRHRFHNGLQTMILLAGIGLLVVLTAAAFGGADGIVLAGLFTVGLLYFSRRMPSRLVMRLHGGHPLHPYEAGELYGMLSTLSERAGLGDLPSLYLIPSRSPNAFTAGRDGNAAIGLSRGLLDALNPRELYGVLAHEIGHIRNGDTGVMTLSDVLGRVTDVMSSAGKLLLVLNLPLVLLTEARFSWTAIFILIFAPTLVDLLRLALSRNREFDADLEAARLTGDPEGLASGLEKIDRQTRFFDRMLFNPGIQVPSFLRTHPATRERIRRLLSLGRPETWYGIPDSRIRFYRA